MRYSKFFLLTLLATSANVMAIPTKIPVNEAHELDTRKHRITNSRTEDNASKLRQQTPVKEDESKVKEKPLIPYHYPLYESLATIDLAYLTSKQGLLIEGQQSGDYTGWSVSSAGDINNDGIIDVIIGAYQASPLGRYQAGEAYVIYGTKEDYAAPIDLRSLNATQGFLIQGADSYDNFGTSVSSAGDVNDDGIADVIIGASNASPPGRSYAGEAYVIYGKNGGYADPIDLSNLAANQGFLIEGAYGGDNAGRDVSAIGDFNNDTIADVIIGAWTASPLGSNQAGASYVIYGRRGGYANTIDLSTLMAGQGFLIEGAQPGDRTGNSVAGTGDINNDAIPDIIIGATLASPLGRNNAGEAYVIYGKNGGYANPIDLRALTASQGFIIQGAQPGDQTGNWVNGAGDFNDDSIADIIIGAFKASPLGRNDAGEAYVIYGKNGGYANPIDLSTLTSDQGFLIEGAQPGDQTGNNVDSAGDVNGDGIADVIIGAAGASPLDRSGTGEAYVIYGTKEDYTTSIDLRALNATQGLLIQGAQPGDQTGFSVSSAGDVNGDGIADMIIGAPYAAGNEGTVYVIYGNDSLSAIDSLSEENNNFPGNENNQYLVNYQESPFLEAERDSEYVVDTAEIATDEATTVTSAASRPMSLFHRLSNYITSWFSKDAWIESYDKVLNSVVAYSRGIVEECPSYYPYALDMTSTGWEGANRNVYNYPIPHIRQIGYEGSFHGQTSNYLQTAVYSPSLPLLPNYQPLMLVR